jgi:hypothetical protein
MDVSFQLVTGGVARGSAGISAAGRPARMRKRLGSTGGELSGSDSMSWYVADPDRGVAAAERRVN